MYSYKEQTQILLNIDIKENETKRFSCPFCGGNNTFSLTKANGNLTWNCYKASCNSRGILEYNMSASDIKLKLASVSKDKHTVPMPSLLASVKEHTQAVAYINKNNCEYAVDRNYVKIFYEPKDARVLFEVNCGKGYIGRSLTGDFPKWKNYGDIDGGFLAGQRNSAVVVEDCASACAVAATEKYTGFALAGTSLTVAHKLKLRQFSRIIICLDRDATNKAMRLKQELQGIVPTTITPLVEDLKCLNVNDILKVLEN